MLLLGPAALEMLHWWGLHMLWIDTSIPQIVNSCRRMLVGDFVLMHCPHLFLCHCCCSFCCLLILTLPADACLLLLPWSSPWWSFQGSLLRYHVKSNDAVESLMQAVGLSLMFSTQMGTRSRALMSPDVMDTSMCLWDTLHDVHEDACILTRRIDG